MSRRSDMTRLSERERTRPTSDLTQLRTRAPAARPVAQAGPAPPETEKLQTAAEIARGLQQSLASTSAGLAAFLAMLRDSGLAEAAHGYRAMQMVLVQQRLWTQTHRRDELLPLFASIAETAGELHRVFASFASVMAPLKELDRLTEATEPEGLPPGAPPVG